jgi:hypothetical protein
MRPRPSHARRCAAPRPRAGVGEDADHRLIATCRPGEVRRTAHEGAILEGTKTDHGEHDAGRTVPVPATLAWTLEAQINLNGEDCELLFPTPSGRLWRERNFYRDVWKRSRPPTAVNPPAP